jgi:hypothetical protein
MSRRPILALTVFAALAGAVLYWIMDGRKKDSVAAVSRVRDRSRYDAATAQSRPVIQHAQTSADERSAKRSQRNLADTIQRAQPAPTAAPQQALPTGSSLERVSSIINAADTDRLYERARAVRAIPTPLTQPETEAFSRYLLMPARNSANREYENWLRNEMLDVMVEQPVLPHGFSDMLVKIYNDKQQDVVMRDYAVQHMVPAYERVNSSDQAKLQSTIWQATTETDGSIAGTGLLALLDLSESFTSPDRRQIAETATRMAWDNTCGELARISAVQVCGRMKAEQAFPVVERLALEAESVPLRIAATASLGEYAKESDQPEAAPASQLLARLANSSDERQSFAAQSALRRLSKQARQSTR